jgi:hypothetical protein
MRLTRWSTLIIAVLLVAVMVVAGACSSKGTAQPTPTPTSQPTATVEPEDTATPAPGDQLPVIASLVANPTNVAPKGSSTVTCVASDPDGDTLNYTWTFTGGTKTGIGDTITWVAPSAAGTYTVSVTVRDGKGGRDKGSVEITVVVSGSTPTAAPTSSPAATPTSTSAPTPTPTTAPAATPTPLPTTGTLDINSNPSGATVSIDRWTPAMPLNTPYVDDSVAPWNHTVKLEYPHYKTRTENVTVVAGETTYLNWTLTYAGDQTLTIQPDAADGKDTIVSSLGPNSNFGSDDFLLLANYTKIYIQFKLSALPSTAVVTNASLSLYRYGGVADIETPVAAYRVTGVWNDSKLTWNNQPGTDSIAVDTEVVPTGYTYNSFITWNITKLCTSWVNGLYANHGVMLSDTNVSSNGLFYFHSSEWTTSPSQRPKLVITYYDSAAP